MALSRVTKLNFIPLGNGPKFKIYDYWYNVLVDYLNGVSTTLESLETGITAFATGGQASGTALTDRYNNVTTCTTAKDSVTLPTAVVGTVITVKNNGATSLDVFPAADDCINALAANLAISVPVNAEVKFVAKNAVTWETDSETLVLNSPSTQAGSIVVRATDSAGEYATTITNASQAAARTYTIPDAGASASFVMTAGANVLLAQATTSPLYLDGITTDHTNTTPMLNIDVDQVGAAINVININLDVTTTGLTADVVNGINIDLDGMSTDNDSSELRGVTVVLTATASSRADNSGLVVGIDGTRDTADTDNGVVVGFTGTMNNAGANAYGIRVTNATFTHTSGVFYGIYVNNSAVVTAGTSYGINVDSSLYNALTRSLKLTSTSAVTGAVTISTANITQTMTGASAVNSVEALQVTVSTAVKLGQWTNAVMAKVDLTTAGYSAGIVGVVCAELDFPGDGVTGGSGQYHCFEAEMNLAGTTGGVPKSFLNMNIWGAQKAEFDTDGFIFDIQGVSVGSGKVFQVSDHTAGHALRIRVNDTPYYILLSDSSH
jgi:hypothetical protein